MKNINVLPNLKNKSAIIYERVWLLEELDYLRKADSHHVLAIDRKIYLKGNYVFTAMQGASMIASLTERLIKAGVTKIIRIGTTGSLRNSHKLFEIVIPIAVYKDEGTSDQYVYKEFPCLCDFDLFISINKVLQEAKYVCHKGVSWTTDGRWVESLDKMDRLKKWGILSVDMETSALYTVSFLRKIPCVALNFISDFPMKSKKDGLRGVPDDYEVYKKELIAHVDKVTHLIVENDK